MHRETTEKIYRIFQTSDKGLSKNEVKKRLEKHGHNEIKAKKQTPLIIQFLEEFKDLMVLILLAAVIIAYIGGEKIDAAVIFFIVVLNALIGFIQKFKAEKALEALQKLMSPQCRVIREGKEMEIEAKYIVPGDIIILNEGDKIPADARLIEEYELRVSEATLTGESTPVKKQSDPINRNELNLDEHENIIFMGTSITSGTGKGVVINTGMNTQFGKIAHLTTSTKKDKSPLEKELFKVGMFVGKVTLGISILLFSLGYFWQGKPFAETFLFAVAVAVAAVPEGLPATITISLALGVQRLAKKNAIVKQLSSVETLGSTTVICSDKTGTLTQNEMTVREIFTQSGTFEVTGSGYDPEKGDLRLKGTNTHLSCKTRGKRDHDLKILQKDHPKVFEELSLISKISMLCNNAKLDKKKNTYEILGDPTEACLLTVTRKAGFDTNLIQKKEKKLFELAFDSERKMMTTIHGVKGKIMAYSKGAPDQLLKKCNSVFINGSIVKLTPKKKEEILKKNNEMAEKALRVIGCAYRELTPTKKKKYSKEEVEKNLTFIGLMGMIDPPRKNVKEAVEMAKKAGIKVYIVTGDYGITAKAIAKEIGLIEDEKKTKVVTGVELNQMKAKDLLKLISTQESIIFARVSPEHKLKIVNAFKHRGEIVAVTGDGVNDAPALKRADIGIAMGITGTDVSKEAANMILTDDSFATIISAIREGRTIYENLKKFILYIFSCNIGELFTVFTAIILSVPAPLTAILILAVDLGTDVLPALAIGVDPPEEEIMKQKPRNQKEHIMKPKFIIHFLLLGIFIGLIATGTFIQELLANGWSWGEVLGKDDFIYLKASTLAFAILVLIQMINAFNARSFKKSLFTIGIFSNPHLLGAVSISIITLFIFVEVPWVQQFLHTVHLSAKDWGIIILSSFSVFFIEEIRKKWQSSFEKSQ